MDNDMLEMFQKQLGREETLFYTTVQHEYYAEKMEKLGLTEKYAQIQNLNWLPAEEMQLVKDAYDTYWACQINHRNRELGEKFNILMKKIEELGLANDYQLYHAAAQRLRVVTSDREEQKRIEKQQEELAAKEKAFQREHTYIAPEFLKEK